MIKEDIIFFIGHINDIGGVEQWIYYISKKYGHAHNITMVFKKAKTMTQIQRLVKNIRCIKYNGEKIECNTIFYCYDLSVVKQVKAKEQILNNTQGKIDKLFDHVVNERTSLGVRVSTAEKIKEFNDENILNMKRILSQEKDTDVLEKFI